MGTTVYGIDTLYSIAVFNTADTVGTGETVAPFIASALLRGLETVVAGVILVGMQIKNGKVLLPMSGFYGILNIKFNILVCKMSLNRSTIFL